MTTDMLTKIDRIVRLLGLSDGQLEADGQSFRVDDGTVLKRVQLSDEIRNVLQQRDFILLEGTHLRLTATGRAYLASITDHPQSFRLQHGAISAAPDTISNGTVGTLIDEAESPLAWLHRRKGAGGRALVDEAEFKAGERLRLDFTKGGLMPSMTSNWRDMAGARGGGRGGRAEMTDAALAARDRVNAALVALGPELAGVAIDVCCFLKGLETVEQERSWPQRCAKVVLKLALQALARHYGISATVTAGQGRGRIQQWGSADYRPRINGGQS